MLELPERERDQKATIQINTNDGTGSWITFREEAKPLKVPLAFIIRSRSCKR